jgi:hypothetical protein
LLQSTDFLPSSITAAQVRSDDGARDVIKFNRFTDHREIAIHLCGQIAEKLGRSKGGDPLWLPIAKIKILYTKLVRYNDFASFKFQFGLSNVRNKISLLP